MNLWPVFLVSPAFPTIVFVTGISSYCKFVVIFHNFACADITKSLIGHATEEQEEKKQ